MLTGLLSSTTALQAFQTALDVTANNISNLSTTAFKSSRVLFADLNYQGPTALQIGHGVRPTAIDRQFSQGSMIPTTNELDLAIDGQGFFAVQLPDGRTHYTRDGALHTDALGRLVTDEGFLLQPPITLPPDTISTFISLDGTVSVLQPSSPDPVVLGQLQVTRFVNPLGLRAEGGNRFSETAASGAALTGIAGTEARGRIRQRSLEQSNVELTRELVRLTNASRSFAINSRAIRSEDQLLQSTLDLFG